MRVLGIIPARAGSRRLPGKNTRPLLDKPLVAWVIEAALQASSVSRLVVSSDDPGVLAIARAYRPGIALTRPPHLASDTAAPILYVQHALDVLEIEERFDAVAIIQPTSPLTTPGDIDATLAVLDVSGADSAVSVVKVEHALHPAKFKVLLEDRLLPYVEDERGRMAAHDLPEVYVRNGSVYAVRRDVIADGLIIGNDCRAYVMPRARSIDINDEMDLAFAEFLIRRAN